MNRTIRIRLLALLVVIGIGIASPRVPTQRVRAYTAPTAPAAAYYVIEAWDDPTTITNVGTVTWAYRYGYYVPTGYPTSQIILAFGRQFLDGVQGWGVDLPRPENGYHTEAWVKARATEFMNGYSRNHTTTSTIAVGTSNANAAWLCNNSTGAIAPDWNNAGVRWGALVKSLSAPAYVTLRSANDIESWNGTFSSGWTACGPGAQSWLDGYTSQTTMSNTNFGSNGVVERPDQWMQHQLYDVSYGRSVAYVYPQIYCSGWASGWVTLRSSFTSLRFSGVTSTNGYGSCGSTAMLGWQAAWNALNDALNRAGFPDNLYQSVASFNY